MPVLTNMQDAHYNGKILNNCSFLIFALSAIFILFITVAVIFNYEQLRILCPCKIFYFAWSWGIQIITIIFSILFIYLSVSWHGIITKGKKKALRIFLLCQFLTFIAGLVVLVIGVSKIIRII
ncbi:MAG: hypothetical protein HY738_00330 [Bacteroidia bacterium]|nr:hypothetical protein [Bacteroidia bacterium]